MREPSTVLVEVGPWHLRRGRLPAPQTLAVSTDATTPLATVGGVVVLLDRSAYDMQVVCYPQLATGGQAMRGPGGIIGLIITVIVIVIILRLLGLI